METEKSSSISTIPLAPNPYIRTILPGQTNLVKVALVYDDDVEIEWITMITTLTEISSNITPNWNEKNKTRKQMKDPSECVKRMGGKGKKQVKKKDISKNGPNLVSI